jgi:FkbM family methyltransferase
MLRRRLQSALFPWIDSKYPPLTHALRLRYNVTLRQGEVELRHVGSLVDRSRAAADIGAHRGVYAHVLARYAKHVHAFEPHPQLCTYLRRVMSDRVTVHPVALSSSAGTVKFRIPRAGSYLGLGQGTLEELPIFHGAAVSEIEVRTSTLDQELRDPVGFMKIDVEGHELSVLEGGRELLRKHQPALMIEIADSPELQHYQRVVDFLAGFGYRAFWLDRGAIVSVARRGPGAAFFRAAGPKGEVLCANFIFLA